MPSTIDIHQELTLVRATLGELYVRARATDPTVTQKLGAALIATDEARTAWTLSGIRETQEPQPEPQPSAPTTEYPPPPLGLPDKAA